MRLLVADDTRDLNRALQAILEQNGYEVVPAYDGQEALDLVMSQSFDAIILDIMMPRMDGLAALAEMRRRGVVAPVLLLTAKAQVDDRVAGLDAGADDYLPKPFAMRELLARVRAMTKRRSDYSSRDLSYADLRLRADSFELSAENTVRLSVKEMELLQLFVLNADRPLGPGFILGRVWEGEDEADEDTLALYVSYLRAKLASVASKATIVRDEDGSYRLSAE